jgi:DNA-binding protein Fis
MEGDVLRESHFKNFFSNLDHFESYKLNEGRVNRLFEIEKEAIQKTLEFTKGNKRQAAQILGIGRATLHRKLKLYQLIG